MGKTIRKEPEECNCGKPLKVTDKRKKYKTKQ